MPYYLFTGRYTGEAIKGMIDKLEDRTGPRARSSRRSADGSTATSWRLATSTFSSSPNSQATRPGCPAPQ
jgi:hypothetical protein